MKKLILFIAVVSAASFASCKKDRVCTCTTIYAPTGGGSSTSSTSIVTYTKAKKGDATSNCLSGTMTDTGGTYTRDCSLN